MSFREKIEAALDSHARTVETMPNILDDIDSAVSAVTETLRSGHKILLVGNGGSAADAQHWAAEWVVRLSHDIDRPSLPAIALTTDTSILTAGGNDIGFEKIFARQIEGLGQNGDLLIAISTTGNSGNLLRAVETANTKSMKTLGILGAGGGKLAGVCNLCVVIPSNDTQRIQEMHVFVGHMLCELSERALYTGE